MIKQAYTVARFSTEWVAKELHLSLPLVKQLMEQLCLEGNLEGMMGNRFAITDRGREQARRLLEICGYIGPAPRATRTIRRCCAGNSRTCRSSRRTPSPTRSTNSCSIRKRPAPARVIFGPQFVRLRAPGATAKQPWPSDSQRGSRRFSDPARYFRRHERRPALRRSPPPESRCRHAAARRDRSACELRIRRPLVMDLGRTHAGNARPDLRRPCAITKPAALEGQRRKCSWWTISAAAHFSRSIARSLHHADGASARLLTQETGQKIEIPLRHVLIVAANSEPGSGQPIRFLRRIGYRVSLDAPDPEQYAHHLQDASKKSRHGNAAPEP